MLHSNFKTIISLKTILDIKGSLKMRLSERFFRQIYDKLSVIERETSSFKVSLMVSLRKLLLISSQKSLTNSQVLLSMKLYGSKKVS